MHHFYYILYDLDSVRKLNPIKRKICYSRTVKNLTNTFETLLDIL